MRNKLYVGNLSFNVTEDALKEAFSKDGATVQTVTIPSDRDTGRPRGFAFVEMESEAHALAAIAAWDGKELDGRALKVDSARERAPRPTGAPSSAGHSGSSGHSGGGRRDR